MIKINYRRYTEEELDKVRKTLGVEKGYRPPDEEIGRLARTHDEEVANLLNIEPPEAGHLILRILTGSSKTTGSAWDFGDDAEVNIGVVGDTEITDETGGVLAHEMGHIAEMHELGPDEFQEASRANPVLRELVAIYYSYLTNKNKDLFDKDIEIMRQQFDRLSAKDPEKFRYITFDLLKTNARRIAKQDLGAATPEQRAMKRQGKRRHNGGSHNTIQGVR